MAVAGKLMFTITCPKCKTEFPLTQTLAQPFIDAERTKLQAQAREREAVLQRREQLLVEHGQQLEELQAQLNIRQAKIDTAVEAKLGSNASPSSRLPNRKHRRH